MATVRLTAEWAMPEAEAKVWLAYMARMWASEGVIRSLPYNTSMAVINSTCCTPPGYHPDLKLEIVNNRASLPDPFTQDSEQREERAFRESFPGERG